MTVGSRSRGGCLAANVIGHLIRDVIGDVISDVISAPDEGRARPNARGCQIPPRTVKLSPSVTGVGS